MISKNSVLSIFLSSLCTISVVAVDLYYANDEVQEIVDGGCEDKILKINLLKKAVTVSRDKTTSDALLDNVLSPLSTQEAWQIIRSRNDDKSPEEIFSEMYPGVDSTLFFGRFIRRRVNITHFEEQEHL